MALRGGHVAWPTVVRTGTHGSGSRRWDARKRGGTGSTMLTLAAVGRVGMGGDEERGDGTIRSTTVRRFQRRPGEDGASTV